MPKLTCVCGGILFKDTTSLFLAGHQAFVCTHCGNILEVPTRKDDGHEVETDEEGYLND